MGVVLHLAPSASLPKNQTCHLSGRRPLSPPPKDGGGFLLKERLGRGREAMLGRSLNYRVWYSGAVGGKMDAVDEGKRFYYFFYGLWNGIVLKVSKKVQQWTSAGLALLLAPEQYFFCHTTLHLGPGFERVTSRFKCLLWFIQGERLPLTTGWPGTSHLSSVSLSTKRVIW